MAVSDAPMLCPRHAVACARQREADPRCPANRQIAMADRFKDFVDVLKAFDECEVDYVLIGGVAVILHGLERLTRDIDIVVRMIPENIDRLRKALHRVFNDVCVEEITLDDLNKYAVVRYGTPTGFCIDIMARLGEVATYDSLQYDTIAYQGARIRIATIEALYELKKDTIRDKDRADAMFLKQLMEARRSEGGAGMWPR